MNESLLNALVKLFAIITDANHFSDPEVAEKVVEDYFLHQYGKSESKKFLQYFKNHLQKYHYNLPENSKADISVYQSRIEQICFGINKEFELKQKLWLTLQLMEFLSDCEYTSKEEIGIVRFIAESFNVDKSDFELGRSFMLNKKPSIPLTDKILVISRNENFSHHRAKHLFSPKMNGKIFVLHLKSTDTYLLKYFGEYNLFLNGLNIKPNRAYIWALGAVIRSSRIDPIYYNNMTSAFIDQENIHKIEFNAIDVSYRFQNSKKGLEKFDFHGESGQLIGIVGSSGCGKSTILNVLNGNLKNRTGTITINGYDLHHDQDDLEGIIGYVPQEDLLFEELTVYQNLYYNARLCFSKFNKEELEKLVTKTIESFDLVEARDLKVGDPLNKILSGGQRKRLNIALELMREPALLFVDEPTSGLSSMDSEKILNLLKRQTFKGKLVIITIHQPSSDLFKLFDKIVVVDQGGRIIFSGNPLDSITYFREKANYIKPEENECITCGNVNSEQILRIVEARVVNEFGKLTRKRKRPPEEWEELFKNEARPFEINSSDPKYLPVTNFNIPNRFEQFKIFFKRNLLSKLSNRQYIMLILLEAPVLAIILGLFTKHFSGTEENPEKYIFAYNDNLPAFIFMSVIVAIFLGLIISAEEIIRDKKILKRESFLNLSRWSYINSKILYLGIISAIQCLLFVIIGNLFLEIRNLYFEYWLILFSTSVCANLFGLNISAAFNSVVSSYITIPFILVPQLLLSGVVVDYKKIHKDITSVNYTPVFGDLMTSRWAYEALVVEQFKNNSFQKNFYNVDFKISNSEFFVSFYLQKMEAIYESLLASSLRDSSSISEEYRLILKNELFKLYENTGNPVFDTLSAQVKDNYKSTDFNVKFKNELNLLRNHNLGILEQAKKEKELVYNKLVKKLNGVDQFLRLKQRNFNEAIASIVLDKTNFRKITVYNNEIIQLKDPIYKIPMSGLGRAHFYAPFKVLGKMKIDTYWFNLAVIWISTLLLYLLLYFDIIRLLVEKFEIIKVTKGWSKKILRV
ncbi:MAG: ATP-binding cassette domain-containing protein [Bacteroidales bacterium]